MFSRLCLPLMAAAADSFKKVSRFIACANQRHLLAMRICIPREHSVPPGPMTSIDWTHYPLWNKLRCVGQGRHLKQGALAAKQAQLVAASSQNDITS
jgi:hypothetical protein